MTPPVDFLNDMIFSIPDTLAIRFLNPILNDIMFSPIFKEVVLLHPYVIQPLEKIHLVRMSIYTSAPDMYISSPCQEYHIISKTAQEIFNSANANTNYKTFLHDYILPVEQFSHSVYSSPIDSSNKTQISQLTPKELQLFFVDTDEKLIKRCKVVFKRTPFNIIKETSI